MLKCFRGVVAGDPAENDANYVPEDLPRSVFSFITGGDSEHHDVLVVRGTSMAERIPPGSEVVVKHDKTPRPGEIRVVRDPEGNTYIKILRVDRTTGREFLESANPGFAKITEVDGWEHVAVAVAIITQLPTGSQNIEWDSGRPLRA